MENILLLGIFESLVLAVLLLVKRNRGRSDRVLAAYFLVYAINITINYIEAYNRSHGFPWPAFILTTAPLILLHGPLIWLYVKSLTSPVFVWRPAFLLHLVPFLTMVFVNWFQLYTLPTAEKIAMVTSESYRHQPSFYVWTVLIAFSNLGYLLWAMWLVRRYQHRLTLFFSDDNVIDLQWLKVLLVSSVLAYGVINGVFVINAFWPFVNVMWMQLATFAAGSVFVLFIGFFGHRQGNVFSQPQVGQVMESLPEPAEMHDPVPPSDELFIRRLLSHMDSEKPWIDPEITLSRLAEQLGTSPDYLSGIMNGRLNRNFFDFVNHYRVEEFKRRCCNPALGHLTLVGIAFDCGFNSKATFNRVFKKFTNYTPSAYKEKVSGK